MNAAHTPALEVRISAVDPAELHAASILVVDDEPANVRLLERVVRGAGYANLTSTTDPGEVSRLCDEAEPDLILLDLNMPGMDGFGVMDGLAGRIAATGYLPILVITSDTTPETRQRALAHGARDFVAKPFDFVEVLLRIRNLLETRLLHQRLRYKNEELEQRVRERTTELESAQAEILQRLALAAEYRDDETNRHAGRVGEIAARVAEALQLPSSEVTMIRRVAPLHDVGKIGTPDAILLKPGRLSPEEFDLTKTHTLVGARILGGSSFPVLQMAEQIALCHHERWDGTGYPRGLRGEEIPIAARIVAVVDVWDALTHERPYKHAWSIEEAAAELRLQAGRHFDPRVLDAFLQVQEKGTQIAFDWPSVPPV
ncbi:MAG: response regulator [Gemmatimonadaceae bacterium]|nr:response regulator [Gemmatimonadaceae bacterium]